MSVESAGFPGGSDGKESTYYQETWVQSLCWEDPLQKGMATHSNILAWRIAWTEETGGLESMGSQRVGHYWVTNIHTWSLQHFFHALFHDHYYVWIKGKCSQYSWFCCSVVHVWVFLTPRTAAHQDSLSFTTSQSLLKLNPGIEPMASGAPTLADRFFTVSTTWEAKYSWYLISIKNALNFLVQT